MTRRRRAPTWSVAVPERLARLVLAEWPDLVPAAALAEWKRARRDWCRSNGWLAAGDGPDIDRPPGPLGDVVEQLQAERAARRAVARLAGGG